MPDYSEYIIKKKDRIEFYNHPRGDYTFICDMFWGYEESVEIIKNQSKIEESKFDNAFSRIIIDETKKEITVKLDIFEHKNGVGILVNQLYLKLLKTQWKDWTIKYAEEGYDDFMRFLIENDYFEDKEYSLKRLNESSEDYLKNAWDEPVGTIVSTIQDGNLRYGLIQRNLAEIISEGEKMLNLKLDNTIPQDKIPFGGIHVNKDEQTVFIWYSLPSPKFKRWTEQYWKNWEVRYEYNGYENHYNKLGLKAELEKIKAELEKEAIGILKMYIVDDEREPYLKVEGEQRIATFRERKILKEKRRTIFNKSISEIK